MTGVVVPFPVPAPRPTPVPQEVAAPTAPAFTHRDGLRYGALAAPLAFAALPLYVNLPAHHAREFGLPLAALGALLLAVRAADALVDPWLGRWADRWLSHSRTRSLQAATAGALTLAGGFVALFLPPWREGAALWAWTAASLALTCFGYSLLGVLHQAWGTRLGGDAGQRARVAGWREGLALAGVLAASVLVSAAGPGLAAAVLAIALVLALALLARAPLPAARPLASSLPWQAPWRDAAFRGLLGVYLVNGLASAVPATLVLFFIRDRLQAPALEPLFLGLYFAAAALAVPLWLRAVARWGLVRSWALGMALSVTAFAWAAALGAGDTVGFALVCAASGLALGADLTVPAALLTGVVQRAGHAGTGDGSYSGWWTLATKLNLALAAGLALPALQALGYRPGANDPTALQALTLAYCAGPCVLKLAAGALLWRWARHHGERNP
ncbi:Na+/melibiose symporter-like transporter [Burkholderiales bacterium JOSHI_001]|nr:Na+/melibiose symporter-like transporter [Burkholderiales bacterium JOSHI_001]